MRHAVGLICLAAVGLAAAGCSDAKPAVGPAGIDSTAIKTEADRQKQMHDREAHGR